MRKGEYLRSGITIGTCLAMIISWSLNQSVIWALIHGVFGWLYVVYYVLILS